MRGGFFAGAVGGLAIALLLVGLVAAFPQANPSAAPATTTYAQVSGGQSAAAVAVPGVANASGSPSAAGRSTIVVSPSSAQTKHEPDSLLAVLPGESVASLIGTLSPLLLGVLVAALLYAAYSRRQDASS
jgi:hypothetical protein